MNLALTYPGGKLLDVIIAATAGNVVTNKSPGALKRWLVLYGVVSLTADGNAANRIITLRLTNGTSVIHNIGFAAAITAGQTGALDIGRAIESQSGLYGATTGSLSGYLGIGDGYVIEGDDQIRVLIGAGLAGDSYEATFRVLELGITP